MVVLNRTDSKRGFQNLPTVHANITGVFVKITVTWINGHLASDAENLIFAILSVN
jgi:hypothetical protein